MNKEEAKKRIKELVERYNKLVAEGKDKKYYEADTRKDLIEPLFEALGWDVRNKEEVAAEETMSKGRVDYSFRINGIPKFYLEAKALKEELKEKDVDQAINYAYVQGCSWAVLTNFKRIEVYNAEWKEKNPGKNLFFVLNVNQFLTDERLFLLSRESFDNGLINQEAEKWGKKAKKIPIDKQLLNDLTNFRELLSKNILKNNASENLTEEQLDESVQRILDRLIFIRYVEDRGFEPPKLQTLVREESNKKLYKRLNEVYRNIGIPYNSILFISHLCDDLVIDDEVLEKVINGLFKTADETVRYDFEIISADVLGNVYEQYLGHILKKTDKRAKLTEGKVHRKEQGIYYTPTYIVDYIIKNTLGELLKDKNVDVSKIRILDPACGSGSFLIKAFDVLEEYHDKHNKKYSDAKKAFDFPRISRVKTDIVLNNLHGVDLDERAIEIAQLNLLLKMTEKRQKLPLLHHNIKCGNSLIDDPEVAGDKAFKWEEQFQEIMEDGGFDVVVGNPPYVSYYGGDAVKLSIKEREYYKKNYTTVKKENDRLNAFWLFIERGTKLLKEGGYFGFIVNKTLMVLPSYKELREYIVKNFKITTILPQLDPFDVVVDATVIILQKKKPSKSEKVMFVDYQNLKTSKNMNLVEQALFLNNRYCEFIFKSKESSNISSKMEQNLSRLGDLFKTSRGMNIGGRSEFFLKESKANEKTHKYFLGAQNVSRYSLHYPSPRKTDKYNFVIFDLELEKKLKEKGATIALGEENRFNQPKLIVNEASKILTGTYDEGNHYCSYSFHIINGSSKNELKYLLGLINSKLMTYYSVKNEILRKGTKATPHLGTKGLDRLPIKTESEHKNTIMKLVDKMLSLNKRLNELGDKKTTERERIEEEIKETDKEIDELVYNIYGITEEEKKVIEDSLK